MAANAERSKPNFMEFCHKQTTVNYICFHEEHKHIHIYIELVFFRIEKK